MTNLKAIIRLLRPLQWAKNIFIFLPLFFNGQLGNVSMLLNCIVAFFVFSLAASSIYCFNDIRDINVDKQHPEKQNRPIASGIISIPVAYLIMIVCLILSAFIFLFSGIGSEYEIVGIIIVYYILNIIYTLVLKQFPIVDVMVIAVGFVLRVLVGAYATDIELSEWIIIMTFLLALFLAFAKRRDDVIIYQNTGVLPRKNTDSYNLDLMNQVMTVILTITIVAYVMYTISPDVIARFHCNYVYLTSVFVLAGMFRYMQITIVDLKSGDPTKVLMSDRFIQVCIACWLISFLIIIYLK
jgi:4-hydroxybenzoate polyprenyltransferase